ncbi:MAG: zinc ABC transporter substrate-binding protein [Actinomycetota bacterium]|nr:zinc ABC transporter substrate-binding protein [Actinomycetota bacterium]MDQ3575861.1 zinc ABC transporter substrate-binding protein [Actinomycetota bacterium]
MRPIVLALAVTLGLGVSACGGDDERATPNTSDANLQVVASFYPVAESAKRVGGQQAEVVNLTPAGTEPHDLELTPRQVDQLEDADLVLYLGHGFQPAVEKVAERRNGPKLDLLSALPLEKGAVEAVEAEEHAGEENEKETGGKGRGEEEHAEESLDPHFWLDPVLMQSAVERIERALSEARPESREEFARNAAAYRSELQALDDEYKTALSSCQRKELVTSHAAFHYLAKRYGLSQEPIAGLSPEAEPNPQRLADLTDFVRRRNATTIFYETLVSPEVARTLARDTGTKTAVLNPLEGLTQEQAERGAGYASVMRENLTALKSALGCR